MCGPYLGIFLSSDRGQDLGFFGIYKVLSIVLKRKCSCWLVTSISHDRHKCGLRWYFRSHHLPSVSGQPGPGRTWSLHEREITTQLALSSFTTISISGIEDTNTDNNWEIYHSQICCGPGGRSPCSHSSPPPGRWLCLEMKLSQC